MGGNQSSTKVDIDKIIRCDTNSPAKLILRYSKVQDIFLVDTQKRVSQLVVKILKKDKSIKFRMESEDPDVRELHELYVKIAEKVAEKRHLVEHDIIWQQASCFAKMGTKSIDQLGGLKKAAKGVGVKTQLISVSFGDNKSTRRLCKAVATNTYVIANYVVKKIVFKTVYGFGPGMLYKTCGKTDIASKVACVGAFAGYIWLSKPLGGLLHRYLRHPMSPEDLNTANKNRPDGIPEYIYTNSLFMATAKVIGHEVIPYSLKGVQQINVITNWTRTPLAAGISVLNNIPVSVDGLIDIKVAAVNYTKVQVGLVIQWGVGSIGDIKNYTVETYEASKEYVHEKVHIVKEKAHKIIENSVKAAVDYIGQLSDVIGSLATPSRPRLNGNEDVIDLDAPGTSFLPPGVGGGALGGGGNPQIGQ